MASSSPRPSWGFGHDADAGGRRVPWIIGGIAVLGAGRPRRGPGVGPHGPFRAARDRRRRSLPISSSALASAQGAPPSGAARLRVWRDGRQAAAAQRITWLMMIFGLAATGVTAGILLDPYSPARLVAVVAGVGVVALILAIIGHLGAWSARPGQGTAQTQPRRRLLRRPAARSGPSAGAPLHHLRLPVDDRLLHAGAHSRALRRPRLRPHARPDHALGGCAERRRLPRHADGGLSGTLLARCGHRCRPGLGRRRLPRLGGALRALAWGGIRATTWRARCRRSWRSAFSMACFAVAAIGAMMALAGEGATPARASAWASWARRRPSPPASAAFLGTAAADIDAQFHGLGRLGLRRRIRWPRGLVFLTAAILALNLTNRQSGGT